ncbi:MAG TPA: 50S ribosomal protein L4 [Dermatophilaceae bacterium]|nr:50S ribosomal protein L4 [Dermatophilaceae bacterium]
MATKTAVADLPAEIFDVQVNVPLIHQVVVAQLAAARQGTHSTKTRGEVRGGGRKPYRQKGTGRARQGSTRAPQFAGGGVVHGPQPRDYAQRTPKKMKAAALRGALSDRARHDRIHVLDAIVKGDAPSAKEAAKVLAGLTDRRNLLVVLERSDQLTLKSVRNLANVHVLAVDQLNTYDVLCADDIVFTTGALAAFVAGPVKGGAAAGDSAEVIVEHTVTDTVSEAPAVEAAPAADEKPAKKAAAKKAASTDETEKSERSEKAPKAAKADKPAKKSSAKKTTDTADDAGKADKAEKPAKKAAAKKAASSAEEEGK